MTKVAIVGPAFGKQDAMLNHPFVGKSGEELYRMLHIAGLVTEPLPNEPYGPGPLGMKKLWQKSPVHVTTLFKERLPQGKIESVCGKKAEVGGKDYKLAPIRPGVYLRPEYLNRLEQLESELAEVRPNITITLGNIACWALLRTAKITQVRGTVAETSWGQKVLPTFDPAMILRAWSNRPVMVADLTKAERESGFPEVRRKHRQIWINPTLEDIAEFTDRFLRPSPKITFDVETWANQITCIGFAGDDTHALVIPFCVKHGNGSYWPNVKSEVAAWQQVRSILNLPNPKEGQNGLYDIQRLWRTYGIPVRNYAHDTMIKHHALYPELQKGLGFQGSIYCNEASWKTLRKESESNKRDE